MLYELNTLISFIKYTVIEMSYKIRSSCNCLQWIQVNSHCIIYEFAIFYPILYSFILYLTRTDNSIISYWHLTSPCLILLWIIKHPSEFLTTLLHVTFIAALWAFLCHVFLMSSCAETSVLPVLAMFSAIFAIPRNRRYKHCEMGLVNTLGS